MLQDSVGALHTSPFHGPRRGCGRRRFPAPGLARLGKPRRIVCRRVFAAGVGRTGRVWRVLRSAWAAGQASTAAPTLAPPALPLPGEQLAPVRVSRGLLGCFGLPAPRPASPAGPGLPARPAPRAGSAAPAAPLAGSADQGAPPALSSDPLCGRVEVAAGKAWLMLVHFSDRGPAGSALPERWCEDTWEEGVCLFRKALEASWGM